jgi:hypothetical protein
MTRARFLVTCNTAKQNKLFLYSEFMKQCMLDTAGAVCLENNTIFENISLSRRRTVCCIENMYSDSSYS